MSDGPQDDHRVSPWNGHFTMKVRRTESAPMLRKNR